MNTGGIDPEDIKQPEIDDGIEYKRGKEAMAEDYKKAIEEAEKIAAEKRLEDETQVITLLVVVLIIVGLIIVIF